MSYINYYNVIYLVENMVSNNTLQITVLFSPHVQSRAFTTKKEGRGTRWYFPIEKSYMRHIAL